MHPLVVLCLVALLRACVDAQSTLAPPGQPVKLGTPGQFEIITESLVSAQQVSSIRFCTCICKLDTLAFSWDFGFHLLYRQGRK